MTLEICPMTLKEANAFVERHCKSCVHYTPSVSDGKPCRYCNTGNVLVSAFEQKNRCIVCGDEIPDGRYVCPKCEEG